MGQNILTGPNRSKIAAFTRTQDDNKRDPNPNPRILLHYRRRFRHPTTADLLLHLQIHSSTLRRSRHFAALLSDRWLPATGDSPIAVSRLNLTVPFAAAAGSRSPFECHVAIILGLLYTLDFSGAILFAANALEMVLVSLDLLFDDCIQACFRFFEAVPWTEEEEEEEEAVLNLIPFLQEEESRDLLVRIRTEMRRFSTA